MKKIITFAFVVLTAVCFVGCGEKEEEVVGIERSVANNMLNAGEDCTFSPDGETFYINKDYDYDGNVDAIIGYTVID